MESEGSGWFVDRIEVINIEISNYEPLAAGSYIKSPKELSHPKKGLINLRNKDNKCFMWCHLRLLHPRKKDATRVTKEDIELVGTLDYSDINFPLSIYDYEKVRKRFNINVNVSIYNKDKTRPLFISKKSNNQELNVLIIRNEEGKSHHVLIKDFNSLMYSTVKTKNHHKKFFCMKCLDCFTEQRILDKHKETCIVINKTENIAYESGTIEFEHYQNLIPTPFRIYADIECIPKKINKTVGSYTSLYQENVPISIGTKLICIDDQYSLPYIIFESEDCINKFLIWVFEQQKRYKEIISKHF